MTRFLVPEPSRPVTSDSLPTFSVLIPAYQAAETIVDAVTSALAQTTAPHEIIVSDDGSTDDLEGALAPFRREIVLLRKQNGGGASALNAAANAASGEFVVVLDADDSYLPDRLSELAGLAAARPDLDLLSTDAYFEVDGRTTGRFNRANPFPVAAQREAILRSCYLFAPAIRRARLAAIGGFDENLKIAYDWDCWIRLILSGVAVGLVDEPLTRYRLHEGSLSANRLAALADRVAVLEKVARSGAGLSRRERRALRASRSFHQARFRLVRARAALLDGDPRSRRLSLELVVSPGCTPSQRLEALAAIVAPHRAAARLAKQSHEQSLLARPAGDG